MHGLQIEGKFIPYEELNSYVPHTGQQRAAISFISAWIKGQETFILQTSGSTGAPRKITATRELMELSAQSTLKYLGLGNQDHALVVMNTRYIAGIMMLVRALSAGMDLTIEEPSGDPDITSLTANFTAVAPLQLRNILEKGLDLSGYKCILVGGAPIDRDLRKLLRFSPPVIFETYGMTETLSHIALRQIGGESPDRYFSIIQEIELETDERDCLKLRGKITGRKWLQTNDRIRLIDNKHFEWLGRADWTINSGGIKIQPEVLEDKIRQHASDRGWKQEFIIHGYPHPKLGSCAILIFEDAVPESTENVLAFLRSFLSKYEIPRKVLSVPSFPRTENGKLLRTKVDDLLPPLSF